MLLVPTVVALAAGWYFGYEMGAYNQVYFDAPGKIIMLEKAFNHDRYPDDKVIKDLIFKQKCILSDVDYLNSTYAFSSYHPVHVYLRDYFLDNIERVCGKTGCTCTP